MRTTVTWAAVLILPGYLWAQEETYHFGSSEERTNLTFESKTDVMTIVGTSRKVSGSATLGAAPAAHLIVPVASLNTGMPARDRVMMGKGWLDEKNHPTLAFKAVKASLQGKIWKIDGEFTMHGVTKPLALEAEVREIPISLVEKFRLGAGKWVRVKTRFTLKLSDFGIKVPEQSVAQVSDAWNVSVEIFGSTEKPAEAAPESKPREEGPDKVFKTREIAFEAAGAKYRFGLKPQHTSIAARSDTVTLTTITMSGLAAIDGTSGVVKLSVPVESLSSGIAKIDAAFPQQLGTFLEFESTKAVRDAGGTWQVEGALRLNGKTQGLSLKVATQEISAELADKQKWGKRPGLKFTAQFTLKLSDFGVTGDLPDEWTVSFDALALLEK